MALSSAKAATKTRLDHASIRYVIRRSVPKAAKKYPRSCATKSERLVMNVVLLIVLRVFETRVCCEMNAADLTAKSVRCEQAQVTLVGDEELATQPVPDHSISDSL